jgi:dipeptidyl aminopeptidase/acylaminoacyl peptidase
MPNPRTSKTALPYGAWPSPITAELLTASSVGLREPGSDGDTRYWLESRATDAGRARLVRQAGDGEPEPVTSTDALNVRSGVHEYGGGAWDARGGTVVVSNYLDNRLYRVDGDEPRPITPDNAGWRFADLVVDVHRDRVFAVREDHTLAEAEPVNTLVVLSLDGPNEDGGKVILSGSDFVSSPMFSDDGSQLAWLTWNHPNMPWDGCELWKADIAPDNTLSRLRFVAGGPSESIFQPRWAANGDLVFVSDRSGWWNLHRAYPGRDDITPLCPMEAEFGVPQWAFSMSTWDFAPNGDIVCSWTRDGIWHVGRLPGEGGELAPFELPFTVVSDVRVQDQANLAIMLAASPTEPVQLIAIDLDTGAWRTLRRSLELDLPEGSISAPEPVSWPTPDGATAHGIYYPPTSAVATGPEGEKPPLIVKSHGGPTSMATADLNLGIQFWTSRGFAWLDVNYGGSTGYGRAYRERLNGQWGIVDVGDCIAGATWLVEQGRVDGDRLVIKGGSAGGYTTLAALTFHDAFRTGVSSYGVGDLETLATDTHKFESRYLDSLVGPYPEAKARYIARSPIHHVERLGAAMLLFQGLDDKVVPPQQSETMAEAVRANGLPVALLKFEGEGHGFRRAETIHRVLEAELSFHSQVLGFPHPEGIPPLRIDNMPPPR